MPPGRPWSGRPCLSCQRSRRSSNGTGNIYEMRIYTFAPGDIPKVLDGWGKAIEAREQFSPLAACWTSDIGGLNKFAHTWVYKDLNERAHIREATRKAGVWPPRRAYGRSARKTRSWCLRPSHPCASLPTCTVPLGPPGQPWPLGQGPRPGTNEPPQGRPPGQCVLHRAGWCVGVPPHWRGPGAHGHGRRAWERGAPGAVAWGWFHLAARPLGCRTLRIPPGRKSPVAMSMRPKMASAGTGKAP
jgi:hypothetical protein